MIPDFFDQLQQVILSLFVFMDRERRTFWLYLLSGLVIAIAVMWKSKEKSRHLLKATFSKKYWFNHSCYTDYQWIVVNQLLKIFLLMIC